jgi:DNA-binding response OmpR family regulator
MKKNFKILLVEDKPEMREIIILGFQGQPIEVLEADTIEQAEKLFDANPDIAAILVDACVPGTYPNTQQLINKFRKTFGGPMIAISSNDLYREMLMKAGCDYECVKHRAAQKLLEVLGL